jgi:hypothetical protein
MTTQSTVRSLDGRAPRRDTTNVFDEQDRQRAIEAYRFFYPTVSAEGIFNGLREAGVEDGKGLVVLAAGPRHLAFTANSDTPYATGVLDLKTMGPTVIELPPGPYIALVDDHHQRWVMDMGIPGPDAGRGGKHLLMPPGDAGHGPVGYHVGRSQTFKTLLAIRALPGQDGVDGAVEALQRVKVHPLRDPSSILPYVDGTKRCFDGTPLRWERGLEFWRRLHAIVDAEPVIDEFRPMYGFLAALGIRKGVPFTPDARMRGIFDAAAKTALEQMRAEAFESQRPDRLVWPDRRWEWVGLIPDDADFETKSYLDLVARDRWFYQAIVTSPAMFRRKPGVGSVYYLAARDAEGAFLDGAETYKLTIPLPVPAKLFWSVTAYDVATRSQVQSPQDNAVLGSLEDAFEPNPDGSIDLCFGPEAPERLDNQWIQTVPGKRFFLYFRIYGPEASALDGAWKLPDPVRLHL